MKRWARVSGAEKSLQEDTVLTYAFTQAPDLCRELSDDLNSSTGDESAGIDRIISRLQEKFGVNKHVDMVKILNSFLNTTRTNGENLVDYITRFERNYAEVKKLGETFSPTCLAILLLRQAQLTDTDSQIITMNLEFDPKAQDADQNFDKCKAHIKKFQHNKTANQQAIGNQQKQSITSTFIASLDDNEDFN